MGCEGRIEEAQGVLKLCDQLKEERTALQEVLVFAWYYTVHRLLCSFLFDLVSQLLLLLLTVLYTSNFPY